MKNDKLSLGGCAIFWLWSDDLTPPETVVYERVTKLGSFLLSAGLIGFGKALGWPVMVVIGGVLLGLWWVVAQNINHRKLCDHIKSSKR